MGVELLKNNYQIVILISIMLVYVFILWNNSKVYDEILTGFWKCSADFLKDADLSSFLLYLAPPNWKGIRPCYILAERGSELIINEPASLTLHQSWSMDNLMIGFNTRTYTACFHDLETDDFPSVQSLVLFPKTGKIILSKGDTVYAILYKDSILTEAIYSIPDEKIVRIGEKKDDKEDEDGGNGDVEVL